MKKQLWTGTLSFIGMLVFLLDSKTALEGAQQGIELCIRTVIPSLFPFFVFSVLLNGNLTGISFPGLSGLGCLFRVPKGAESLLLCGFLGGYPIGAQSIAQAWRRGELTGEDAERMLSFCSNAGPAFLFGMVAPLFSCRWTIWLLWGIHITSAWMVSRIFPARESCAAIAGKRSISLPEALSLSLKAISQVCGWVVVFRVVTAFLSRWFLWYFPPVLQAAVTGFLELSNGCCALYALPEESTRFVLASAMLAFGGICVTMQTVSVTEGLSLKPYLTGKFLQTLFSILISTAVVFRLWYLIAGISAVFLFVPRKTKKTGSILRKAVV